MARRLGAKEEWLLAVRRETPEHDGSDSGSVEDLDAGWKVALRYAEAVTESGHAVADADFQSLAEHWREDEIIEITLVIGLFSYFNRVNDALRVDITR